MINKKAAELYILSKQTDDTVTILLKALSIIKESSIDELKKIYTQLKAGKLPVAEVISAIELSQQQKEVVENEVISELKTKPIFLYSIDTTLLGGFIVKINDNVIDNSLLKKIRELEIK